MNKPYKIGKSNIEGQGLIAAMDLKPGDLIGLSHSNGEIASEIGQYYNHSDTPNAVSALVGNDRYVIASDNISMGGEITLDYRRQPELEQPEDFMNKAQNGGSPVRSFEESIIDSIGFDRNEGQEYAYDILDRKYKQKYLNEWNSFSKEEKDKWKKSKAFEYAKSNMDLMGIPWEEQSDAENYWTSWKIDNHIFDDYNHAIQSYLLAKKIGPTKATMYSAAHEGSNLFEGIKHTFKGDFGAIPQVSGDSATDMRNNLIGINAFKEGLSIDELVKILEDDGAYREKFDGIYKDRSWSDLFSDIFSPKRMQGGGGTVVKPVINFGKKLLKKIAKDNRYLPITKWQNVLNKNFNTGEQLLLTRALENNPNLVQNSMIDLKALETFANYDLDKSLPRFTPVSVNTDDAGMLTSNWKSYEADGADFGAHRLPNLMPSQFKYAGYQGGNTFRMPGTNRFTPLNYSFAMPQLFTDPLLPTHHDGLHLIDDKAIGWFRGLSDAQNPNRYIAQEFQMDLGKDRQNTYLAERLDMGYKRPNTLSLGLSGRLENQKINYAQMLRNIDKRTSHDTRTLNDLNSNLSIKQAEYNNKYGLEEYADEIPTLENEISFIQNKIRELNKKIGEGNIELVTERFKSITDPLQASRIMQSPYMTLHNESLNFLRNQGFNQLVIPDAKTITNIQNWTSPNTGTLDLYTRLRNNPMLQQGDPFKFDEYQGTIFNILDKPYKRFKQDGGEENNEELFSINKYNEVITPEEYTNEQLFDFLKNNYNTIDTSQQQQDLLTKFRTPAFLNRYKKNYFNITGEQLDDDQAIKNISEQYDFTSQGAPFHVSFPFVRYSPKGIKQAYSPYIQPYHDNKKVIFSPGLKGLYADPPQFTYKTVETPNIPELANRYSFVPMLFNKRNRYSMVDDGRDIERFDDADETIVHEYAHSYNTEDSPLFKAIASSLNNQDDFYYKEPGKRYKGWLTNLFGEEYFDKEKNPYGEWAMQPMEISSMRAETETKLKDANIWDYTKGEFGMDNLNAMLKNKFNMGEGPGYHLNLLGYGDLQQISTNKQKINREYKNALYALESSDADSDRKIDFIKYNILEDYDGNPRTNTRVNPELKRYSYDSIDIDTFNKILSNSQSDIKERNRYASYEDLLNDYNSGRKKKRERAESVLNTLYDGIKTEIGNMYNPKIEEQENILEKKKEEVLPKMDKYFNEIVMEDEESDTKFARYGKELALAQDGTEKKMFDWKGYFSGEQGIIPDLYGESTKETYVENKDNIQNVLDVASASNIPIISQFATFGSLGMDLGDAYSAYKEGDIDTAKDELTSAATNTALKLSGLGAAKFLNKNTKNVAQNIAQGVVNTAGRYGTKKSVNSGVQEAIDTITDTNQSNVGDIAQSPDGNTKAMMGGEVYKYERSPFKDGKFVISNPANLIMQMSKTEIFTPEFKMGGVVTADGFTLEKMFDNKRKLPFVQYSGEPDIEGRVYYDDNTNEIVDVTTLELKKKRKHNRIKTIIEKYESGKDLSGVEIDALNSLGLLD